jgi:ribokinase
VIVVVGRPSLVLGSPPLSPDGGEVRPGGRASRIALAAAQRGAEVQLVGTIGDDDAGDAIAVGLGQAGVGHAALLRDPAARTPREDDPDQSVSPRLGAGDVQLGLGYLSDFRVLVLAEPLPPDAQRAALDAADYQGAAVIAVVGREGRGAEALGEQATVLEAPEPEGPPFAELIAAYAVDLDRGVDPATAFEAARRAAGWSAEA